MDLNYDGANLLVQRLEIIRDLQAKYSLPNDSINERLGDLKNFRVTTPIVGKFSSGKSSLLNSLLGKKYLGTDLTPETSVPTEIFYADVENFFVFEKSGAVHEFGIEEFSGKKFQANEVSKVRLALDNNFLRTVPTVKIVDMPGFDSGLELHNKAIDDYLVESLAYILTFAATEPVIPDSIANFLRELKFHQKPVYIVITKSKSVTPTQLKSCVENIRRNAADYLGLSNAEICCTNAKGKIIDVQDFAQVLQKIEGDSQKILADELTKVLHVEAGRTAQFLHAVIRQTDLTPSELESKKEDCRRNLERLKENLSRTRQDFSKQVDACINSVQADVSGALYSAAANLETALINRTDISAKVNSIVREAVIRSMQSEFAPKFKRYVEKMTAQINTDTHAEFNFEFEEKNFAVDAAVRLAVSTTVKRAVPAILSIVGLTVSGPVVALISLAASFFVGSEIKERRQNEQRMQLRRQIHNEIIPQIVGEVTSSLRQQIYSQLDGVNAQLEAEAQKLIHDQEKILAELTKNFELETAAKRDKLQQMNADLKTLSQFLSTDFVEVVT